MSGSRTDPRAFERSPHQVVLVSGFLYSGSGAVFDHVRGLEGVTSPFEDREVGFLKKPGNFGVFFDPGHQGDIGPELLVDVVLSSVLGFGQSGRPILGSFVEPEGRLDDLMLLVRRLLGEFHDHVMAPAPDDAAVRASIRRFVDAVVAELVPTGHVAVLNNAVIGHQLHRLQAFSDARAVAVVRDPRDQYVSQMLESPYPLACEDFIAMMQDRYRAFQECQRSPEIGDRVCAVRFEDFVLDEEVRRATLRELGLSHLPVDTRHAHFRPEVSRRNVGIYTDVAHRSEVARVAEGLLSEYEELITLR